MEYSKKDFEADGSDAEMSVQELVQRLLETFPATWAEPWDKVGLLAGDERAMVRRVAVALDATRSSVCRAAEHGANVLVTHHPVCLEAPVPLASPAPNAPLPATCVWEAVRKGVSLVSLHTNFDRSARATAKLPQMLGLTPICGIEAGRAKERGRLGSVAELEMPMSLDAFATRCREVFGAVAQVYGVSTDRVSRIAFFTGSMGSSGDDALASGANVAVCGECGYHRAIDLCERGCAVIILGHDVSELPLADELARAVVEAGVPPQHCIRLEEKPRWFVPDRNQA